jgi:hypothetical protein
VPPEGGAEGVGVGAGRLPLDRAGEARVESSTEVAEQPVPLPEREAVQVEVVARLLRERRVGPGERGAGRARARRRALDHDDGGAAAREGERDRRADDPAAGDEDSGCARRHARSVAPPRRGVKRCAAP